jgi:glycosyltransferase involved in cell wall biosynthesis
MLRVLTLSSLFPDASRPNFGVFVGRQTLGLAALPGVDLRVVAPIGMPPAPFGHLPHYAPRLALPDRETWHGLEVRRPRFTILPGTGGRFHVASLVRRLKPVLAEIRRDFPFDVIDAQFFFPDGPAAVALGRHFGVPVSIKARGADVHYWGKCTGTAGQVLEAGRRADGLLSVSQAMRSDMIALGMRGDAIRVHHTGVDLDRFVPADRIAGKAALGVSGPLVVSLGALIPRKRHDVVIRAVASLPGVSLLVAGEGPDRAALEAQIARSGAGDRIRLLGAVPHEDLHHVLAAADVMALCSASEGLANAWVESLACGTPVVVTAAGGAAEIVDSPNAGRIVASDADAFAGAIADLIAHPPAQAATRAAAERFTWEANSAGLYAYLSSLAAGAQSNG